MQKKNNTIRLKEQEFHALIEESVTKILNEGKYGKIGDFLAAGALGGSLALGALGTMSQDPKQSDYYPQEQEISMYTDNDDDEVTQWMIDHNIEDTPENREMAWSQMHESKFSANIDKIIKEEISKVL